MSSPILGRTFLRRIIAVFTGLLLAVTLAGCATGSLETSGDEPTTLRLATGFAIEDIDPMTNGFWGNEFGWSELLMRPVLGDAPQPWLLESLERTDDLTWVLRIEQDARFQNGTDLDGAALAAVLTYSLANVAGLGNLSGTTATATGDKEVTLTTPRPVPNMDYLLADESKFVIFDSAAYEGAKGNPGALIEAGIYTGPYVVDSVTTQAITMTADEDYWGGTPPLEGVTVKFIEEAQARILAVQNGEADLALYPPTDAAKSLAGRSDAFWLKGTPRGPTFQLQLNQKTGPLTDPLVRKAVLAAIDYQELAEDVMDGLYEVSDGMYSPTEPYHQSTVATDTVAAETWLAEAGYGKDGSGNLAAKDGRPLTLTVLTYPQQPDSGTLAIAVQSQLVSAGITVEIQQVPDLDEAMQDPAQQWDASIIGNGTTSFSGDPISPLHTYFKTDGPGNYFGLSDPNLDALIDTLSVTMDSSARSELLRQIQTIVSDNAYMGFLGMRIPGVVAGPAWQDYQMPTANLWVGSDTKP